VSVALIVLNIVISSLSVFTFGLTLLLSMLLSFGGLLLWLFMMWKTYQNEKVVLPIVGPLAEKQA
jgi:uncharacterized membrane protein